MKGMKQYIGAKVVQATPMDRGNYNIYRGWKLLEDENPNDSGYLIEYDDNNHCHPNHKGYISWSPKDVFEAVNRPTDGMSFGLAIEAMKKGNRVTRAGWNGKGIFIGITEPGNQDYMTESYMFIDTLGLATDNPDAAKCRIPWLASQTDMLADDWGIV